jgi:thiamine-monophosphate kinase
MMDLSDGLAGDIRHICQASGAGVVLEEGQLPISSACREIAQKLSTNPISWALSGGEDYELLMIVDPNLTETVIDAIQQQTQTQVTRIGEIREQGITIKTSDQIEHDLTATGYHHF